MSEHHEYQETRTTYDRIASAYADRWFESETLRPELRKFMESVPEPRRIIDVGCGIGRDVETMLKAGVDVIGIDSSPGMLAEARRLVPGAIFRHKDLLHPRLPTSFYSGIWCAATIHHLRPSDQKRAFEVFASLLSNDGVLFVSTNLGAGQLIDEYGRHKFLVTPDMLSEFAAEAGLDVETLEVSESTEHETSPSRNWVQLTARKRPIATKLRTQPLCFFCDPLFFPTNRQLGLPVVGSITFGSEHCIFTVDAAPLVHGHALLITRDHVVSSIAVENEAALEMRHARDLIRRIYRTAFNSETLFLEHGSISPSEGSCIEHAHLHCVPSTQPLLKAIEDQAVAMGMVASSPSALKDERGTQFLSVAEGIGPTRFLTVAEGVPSQFIRQMIAQPTSRRDHRWVEVMHTPQNAQNFASTLETLHRCCDELLWHES